MNMSLQIVENAQFGKVRLQMINEVPWFCGKDVCDVLGYTNHKKAIKDHCRENGVTKCYLTDSKDSIKNDIGEKKNEQDSNNRRKHQFSNLK